MSTPRTEFLLMAGEPVSQDLIEALDTHNTVQLMRMVRSPNPGGPGWRNTGAMLRADSSSPAALETHAGREAIRAIRKIFSLCLGEPANNGPALCTATQPHAHEQLAANLVKLQGVVDILVVQVRQMELVVEKVQCAHGASIDGKPIVAQAGGAA